MTGSEDNPEQSYTSDWISSQRLFRLSSLAERNKLSISDRLYFLYRSAMSHPLFKQEQ